MREVRVHSTQSNETYTFRTNAKTWGEITSQVGDHSGMKVIIRDPKAGTRMTPENKSAVLPEADFQVFLSPQKIKAGVGRFSA